MHKISDTQFVRLKFDDISKHNAIDDNKGYVWDNASFFVSDARLRNIELRLTFLEGSKLPNTLKVYYFQQISSCQIRSISLLGYNKSTMVVRTEESDFWKINPLVVDKIGFYSSDIKEDFKFKVDAFKFI